MATGSGGSAFARSANPIEKVLENVEWPEKFPYKDEDFQRFDETPDSFFYSEPCFVTHIDDYTIHALTKYYSKVFPLSNTPGVTLLDICSSWVSHFPAGHRKVRIVGMGMHKEELKRNTVLSEYIVRDLNVNPSVPFEDSSCDVITNVFSNRCFWTKATSTGDADHVWIVGSYFHYTSTTLDFFFAVYKF